LKLGFAIQYSAGNRGNKMLEFWWYFQSASYFVLWCSFNLGRRPGVPCAAEAPVQNDSRGNA